MAALTLGNTCSADKIIERLHLAAEVIGEQPGILGQQQQREIGNSSTHHAKQNRLGKAQAARQYRNTKQPDGQKANQTNAALEQQGGRC